MSTPKRCKLARYAAGSPKLAFLLCNRTPMHQPPYPRPGCGCMWPACEREQIAYSSLLRRPETVHADPEAMQARLIRGRLA